MYYQTVVFYTVLRAIPFEIVTLSMSLPPDTLRPRSERVKKPSLKAREAEASSLFQKLAVEIKRQSAFHKGIAKDLKSGSISRSHLDEVLLELTGNLEYLSSLYEQYRLVIAAPEQDIRQAVDRLSTERSGLLKSIREALDTPARSERSISASIPSSSIHIGRLYAARSEPIVRPRSSSGSTISFSVPFRSVGTPSLSSKSSRRRAEIEAQIEEDELNEELQKLEIEQAQKKLEISQRKRRVKEKLLQELSERDEDSNHDDTSQVMTIKSSRSGRSESKGSNRSNSAISIKSVQELFKPVVKEMSEAISAAKGTGDLPPIQPFVFQGKSLEFPDWWRMFSTLIDNKPGLSIEAKIYYLKKYLGGEAKDAVLGFLAVDDPDAYDLAKSVLKERYGDPFVIAESYRTQLEKWPKVKINDNKGLQKYADFLRQCSAIMATNPQLQILNDVRENQRLVEKLPFMLSSSWNRKIVEIKERDKKFPTFQQFVDFLTREAKILNEPTAPHSAALPEVTTRNTTPSDRKPRPGTHAKAFNTAAAAAQPTKVVCLHCKKHHSTADCFSLAITDKKIEFIKEHGLCYKCLKKGHLANVCKVKLTCKKCKGNHSTVNHKDSDEESRNKVEKPPDKEQSATCRDVLSNQYDLTSSIVPVWLSHENNLSEEVLTYALLDSQSDTTFIQANIGESLSEAKPEPTYLTLTTMSNKVRIQCSKYKGLVVRGYNSPITIKLPAAFSRELIPGNRDHIPTKQIADSWPHLSHLAHEMYPELPCEIGLLIGYNCTQALAPREVVSDGDLPFAVKTDLGWTITGHTRYTTDSGDTIGAMSQVVNTETNSKICLHSTVKEELVTPSAVLNILEKDFQITESGVSMSRDDKKFLEIVESSVHLAEDGFITMDLPFKSKPPKCDSYRPALKRFNLLEAKFRKEPKFKSEYFAFMDKIIEEGEAEMVSLTESAIFNHDEWFIPHFGVFHPKKGKLRVVFDCSSKVNGVSLNDYLLQGPDHMNSLVGILLRFRKEKIAFTCDIERMFHRFRVTEKDRCYLRFIWYKDGERAIYQMKVHLFGATSSPGCSSYGLRALAKRQMDSPMQPAVHFVCNDFYVDDGLASANTVEEASKILNDAMAICASGKVRLHKVISNSSALLQQIPVSERAEQSRPLSLDLETPLVERVLGVVWCTQTDTFRFEVNIHKKEPTRRGILSTVSSLYDPLGLVAPFIVKGKSILQAMCRNKLDWDDSLPPALVEEWEAWLTSLQDITEIHVPRCLKQANKPVITEIHHFCDASMTGYGHCCYVRTVDDEGEVNCTFLIGKARVAPLKTVTIPRLELQAAVLAVKMSQFINSELDMKFEEHYWTDSKIVLAYINNESKRFHTYVANRVETILSHTTVAQWHHVKSEQNPADHCSRGLAAAQLMKSNWFTGPPFLYHPSIEYTNMIATNLEVNDPEVRATSLLTNQNSNKDFILVERVPKFSDLKRAVLAISKLQTLARSFSGRKGLEDKVSDLQRAEQTIIKQFQLFSFSTEVISLRKSESLPKNSQLVKLNPFIDDQGLLRVGGRLQSANTMTFEERHPIILPKGSHLSLLIIKHYHNAIAHQGRGMTIAKIRSAGYWIIGITGMVSSFIHHCVSCNKLRGQRLQQQMAPLPEERTTEAPPFTHVGLDCFGPFEVKDGRTERKRWCLLITCMASRAIHIEVLCDMTTDSFINSLRCVIALRGNIRTIRCDRGTNFIGAITEFKNSSHVNQLLLDENMEFILNPPHASHMGGVWERQIRTAKSVLSGLLLRHNHRLTTESLRTLLYEVAAIVNSRPLGHLIDEMTPLSPNMLLTMKSSIVLPPPGRFDESDIYSRKQWIRVQAAAQQFWQRWKKEYLSQLQVRSKWVDVKPNLKVDDIVIINDPQEQQRKWYMGRILECIQSKDGLVRSVKLKTAYNKEPLIRPIAKLVNLHINTSKI